MNVCLVSLVESVGELERVSGTMGGCFLVQCGVVIALVAFEYMSWCGVVGLLSAMYE